MTEGTERSAIITGASRGIGLQIAKRLARQGFSLTISSRSASDLESVAASLEALGAARVTPAAADMADVDALPTIFARHAATNPDLSVLIVNAGVGTAGTVDTYPMRRFDKTVAVNLRAPFQLIQLALPALRAAAVRHPGVGAKIVVVSSITGVYAEAGLAAYGATKAAVLSLVETVNAEESAHGVTASAIAPAYVNTDMSAWVTDRVPAETMIPADDVAALVAALVDLSARSMVGRVVVARAGTDGYRA